MMSGLVSFACDHYITLNKLGLSAIIQNTALTLLGNLPEQCFETNASSVPHVHSQTPQSRAHLARLQTSVHIKEV